MPAIPIEIWRADDVSQETAPFHQRAFDVSGTKRVVGQFVTRARIRHDFANDFGRAGAVLHRHAHLQITGMIGTAVNALAKDAQMPAQRSILAGKARTGTNVGEIKNEIVDRISFVFERGGDGETFAGVEKAVNTIPRRVGVPSLSTKPSRRQA